ncbi:hypothetical protein [Alkalihalobacillus sp. LMS39]|uniref:hypothetical protein n=1 Tax=Alkalihalobacillus sp. LMS39 TaxID=2924032 RepID=UPI001FB296CC|nr:hypothetical protein [Alkalihalobacillus sp. LMS39]UOE92146.1 hypothetical protein MM271_12825 [Alkalihalobacillus sp. LMS39]
MSILSPNIEIGTLRIGTIEGASCLNIGNNFPINFRSQKKHTQGFGTIGGDQNKLDHAKAVVIDSDVLEAMNIPESEIPSWVKDLAAKTT